MDYIYKVYFDVQWRLKFLATLSVIFILLYVAVTGASAVLNFYAATHWGNFTVDFGNRADWFIQLSSIGFLFSAVVVSIWIYRAHANLTFIGMEGLEFTPGWSVGWFFVPFANLVMPYRAMRELWERSGATSDIRWGSVLPSWWGTFLFGGLLENIGSQMIGAASATAASNGILILAIAQVTRIVSALLLMQIIRTSTRAESTAASVSATFA